MRTTSKSIPPGTPYPPASSTPTSSVYSSASELPLYPTYSYSNTPDSARLAAHEASNISPPDSEQPVCPPPGYSRPRSIMRVRCGHMRCQLDVNNMCANFAQDEHMPNYAGENHCRDAPPPPSIEAPSQPLTVIGDVSRLQASTSERTKVFTTDRNPPPVQKVMTGGAGSRSAGYHGCIAEEDEEMPDASASESNS